MMHDCINLDLKAWARTEGDLMRGLMSHVIERSRRNKGAKSGPWVLCCYSAPNPHVCIPRSGFPCMDKLKKLIGKLKEEAPEACGLHYFFRHRAADCPSGSRACMVEPFAQPGPEGHGVLSGLRRVEG